MKKTINFLTVSLLAIACVGCGGGGSSADNSGSMDNIENNRVSNNIDSIEPLKPYLYLANKLVTGKQKRSCMVTQEGTGGYVLSYVNVGSTIQFAYKEYDNISCVGSPKNMELSYYSITVGDEINEGRALEINLQFDHGDNIVDKVPNHMLGYDINTPFYTTMVASGNESTKEIKIGIAIPSESHPGTLPSNRANDVDAYISGKYYFSN